MTYLILRKFREKYLAVKVRVLVIKIADFSTISSNAVLIDLAPSDSQGEHLNKIKKTRQKIN